MVDWMSASESHLSKLARFRLTLPERIEPVCPFVIEVVAIAAGVEVVVGANAVSWLVVVDDKLDGVKMV